MRGSPGGSGPVCDRPGPTALRRQPRPEQTLPQDDPILHFRLAAIVAAQLFDFVTFTLMVERHGINAELNPLVAASFHAGGLPILFAIKLALVLLVGSTIAILGRRGSPVELQSKLASIITVLAVLGGVFGGFSNAISI